MSQSLLPIEQVRREECYKVREIYELTVPVVPGGVIYLNQGIHQTQDDP